MPRYVPLSESAKAELDDALERELTGSFGDKQEGELWHYTDGAGLLGIVKSGAMWASHYRFTNDTTEITVGEQAVHRAAEAIRDSSKGALQALFEEFIEDHSQYKLTQVSQIYIASFVQREAGANDDLVHWRSYGAKGDGYALVFGNLAIPEADNAEARLGAMLVSCAYDLGVFEGLAGDYLRRMGELTMAFIDKYGVAVQSAASIWLLRQAAALTPRMKHSAFESEHEWRYVIAPLGPQDPRHPGEAAEFRCTERGILPYVAIPLHPPEKKNEMPLKAVIVGPARDQERRVEGARLLLRKYDFDPDIVKASSIPFRG
jgi:hypothetical protein